MLNTPLKIDAEFKAVCPPLTKEERAELTASIKKDGLRQPILTWHGYIIDGHNRYEICEELCKSYTSEEVLGLNSRAEVVEWIIRNQFGRRNLTAMQRAELALKLKAVVAAEAKKRQGARNDLKTKKDIPQKSAGSQKGETRDELAKLAGVSHDTIAKVEKIVAEAEPRVVEAARSGEMSINAAYKTVAPTPPKTPVEPPASVADFDAPESEERAVEPPSPVPVRSVDKPAERMKNWQRFSNRDEATKAHAAEKIVFGCGWGEIEWLYMDYIPDEPRIDYLRRLEKHGILKSEGFKELKRLEKAEKKGATK